MEEEEIKVFIDVDGAIKAWNKNNPDKRQMNKKSLRENLGVSKSMVYNWEKGNVSSYFIAVLNFLKMTESEFKDVIKIKRDGQESDI